MSEKRTDIWIYCSYQFTCRSPYKDKSDPNSEIKEPVSAHLIVSETGGGDLLFSMAGTTIPVARYDSLPRGCRETEFQRYTFNRNSCYSKVLLRCWCGKWTNYFFYVQACYWLYLLASNSIHIRHLHSVQRQHVSYLDNLNPTVMIGDNKRKFICTQICKGFWN
jgi:hypothetical protein